MRPVQPDLHRVIEEAPIRPGSPQSAQPMPGLSKRAQAFLTSARWSPSITPRTDPLKADKKKRASI